MTHASLGHVSNALKNKRFLTKIVLDQNNIGVEGAAILAEGLKSNETLTNLHLSHCGIGEKGA